MDGVSEVLKEAHDPDRPGLCRAGRRSGPLRINRHCRLWRNGQRAQTEDPRGSPPPLEPFPPPGSRERGAHAQGARGFSTDTACPVSTGRGTRRVQSVRGEGRSVSSQYGGAPIISSGMVSHGFPRSSKRSSDSRFAISSGSLVICSGHVATRYGAAAMWPCSGGGGAGGGGGGTPGCSRCRDP